MCSSSAGTGEAAESKDPEHKQVWIFLCLEEGIDTRNSAFHALNIHLTFFFFASVNLNYNTYL